MRSRLALCLALTLVLGFTTPAAAIPAVPVDNGMVIGGQWTMANTTKAEVTNLTDLKAVTEVYTATWCESCVYVEHALKEVHENGHITPYHFHSTLSDPFGEEVLEQRFRDRYAHLTDYSHSPPGAVFNGTVKKVGKNADVDVHDNDHDNRVEELTGLAQQDLALGAGTTSFSWTPVGDSSGTIGWALDIDDRHLANMTLSVAAWVVESEAEYEEGANGQGTYPHIVRNIINLGNQTEGTATLDLPTPHDGNDLEVHLIYEIVPLVVEDPVQDDPVEEESEDTPALSVVSTVLVVGLALAFTRRDRRDR